MNPVRPPVGGYATAVRGAIVSIVFCHCSRGGGGGWFPCGRPGPQCSVPHRLVSQWLRPSADASAGVPLRMAAAAGATPDPPRGAGAACADGVVIRVFAPSDQPQVRALFAEGMSSEDPERAHAGHQRHTRMVLDTDLRDIAAAYCRGPATNFWVALEGARVVGFVGLTRSDDGAPELCRFQVAATHRRRGIGRRLLATLEAYVRGRGEGEVVLSTIPLHRKAMRFYESEGFERVKEVRKAEYVVVHYRKRLC